MIKCKKEKGDKMYTIEEFDQGKIKVLKYILYKKRSEQEVRNKFTRTMEEDLLEDVIAYLKEAQYIDDQEYIERTVHNFTILKNLSIKEIRYKLMTKGLKKEDIENYIDQNREELKEYEQKSAENLVYKKNGTMEAEEIKQYLIKKGYSLACIQKALEE